MSIQEQLKKQANQLTALLDIDAPLIGAPMMGATTAQMVAEISNAGGLGVMPCGIMNASEIIEITKR